jgi:hypothetical protein
MFDLRFVNALLLDAFHISLRLSYVCSPSGFRGIAITNRQAHAAVLRHHHAMHCRACTRALKGLSRLAAPASHMRFSCVKSNPSRGGRPHSAQENRLGDGRQISATLRERIAAWQRRCAFFH